MSDFLMGGAPTWKFTTVGDKHTGAIIEEPEVQQQTDFDTGEPLTFDDGKPRRQLMVTMSTDERDPEDEDDDGERRVYIKSGMTAAVRKAVKKAHRRGLDIGGVLTIEYVGDAEPKRKGGIGAKLYTAEYIPPAAEEDTAEDTQDSGGTKTLSEQISDDATKRKTKAAAKPSSDAPPF